MLHTHLQLNILAYYWEVGLDSSVGIATRYGLESQRIESRWGSRFSAAVQTGAGTHPDYYTLGTGSFPGGKTAGAWRWPPIPPSAKVKERVELYLCSPSGPSWPVLGWAWPLLLPLPFTTGNLQIQCCFGYPKGHLPIVFGLVFIILKWDILVVLKW
jgi:hypothetical protein